MRKPIIGIVSKHYIKDKKRNDTYIRDEVKQAIFDNGGIAIGILPSSKNIKRINDIWCNDLSKEEYDNIVAQINLCDGIIFQGGNSSDNYECILARYCYDNDIPTLGICCGQNIMVRALGGTTIALKDYSSHFEIGNDYAHEIEIDKDSKLYSIIGKEKIKVNSRHKKIVENHPLLNVSAVSDDGVIEVLESKDKTFYIALRFHPESLYKKDENMNKIFKSYIEIIKKTDN